MQASIKILTAIVFATLISTPASAWVLSVSTLPDKTNAQEYQFAANQNAVTNPTPTKAEVKTEGNSVMPSPTVRGPSSVSQQ